MTAHKYIKWFSEDTPFTSEEYSLNNNLAKSLASKSFDAIQDHYTGVGTDGFRKMFSAAGIDLAKYCSGKGIDLGGGPGVLTSFFAMQEWVDEITCCEIVENCIKDCHPIVFNKLLTTQEKEKVVSVWGSFDEIAYPDDTLDFAVFYDAMHHSNDPTVTLKEVHRALKPGGFVIILDRFHNDSTSDEEIERLLNIQYSEEFLRMNFLDPKKILTRRMNGEHEYRYSEWLAFFGQAGFALEDLKVLCSDPDMEPNDVGYSEIPVDFAMGGFFKRKAFFVLRSEESGARAT